LKANERCKNVLLNLSFLSECSLAEIYVANEKGQSFLYFNYYWQDIFFSKVKFNWTQKYSFFSRVKIECFYFYKDLTVFLVNNFSRVKISSFTNGIIWFYFERNNFIHIESEVILVKRKKRIMNNFYKYFVLLSHFFVFSYKIMISFNNQY
jgi:hypothetical protein